MGIKGRIVGMVSIPALASVGVVFYALPAESFAALSTTTLAMSCGAIVAATALAAMFGMKTIARPLAALGDALDRTAKSDLSFAVPEKVGEDAFGTCWSAVAIFRDWRSDSIRLTAERSLAETTGAQNRRDGVMALATEFETAVGTVIASVSKASEKLVEASEALMSNAVGTTEKSIAAASAAEQTYANVQSVASASEELSASFREIGMQIGHAAKLISLTADKVDSSDSDVQNCRRAHSGSKPLSASSATSPNRPISWPSTQPSRPRVRVKRAAGSRSLHPK